MRASEVKSGYEVAAWLANDRLTGKKPTAAELRLAKGKMVADLIGPNLKILFCGLNPSLYSAAIGHQFARPGNRFWPAMWCAGVTPRLLRASEERLLEDLGIGITNVVARATATAAEVTLPELLDGRTLLEGKVKQFKPRALVFLGLSAFRNVYALPKATTGKQSIRIGDSAVWVLDNPSELNAYFCIDDAAKQIAAIYAAKT